MAKKKLSKFFVNEIYQSDRYFYEYDLDEPDKEIYDYRENEDPREVDYTVYEADKTLKRKLVRP